MRKYLKQIIQIMIVILVLIFSYRILCGTLAQMLGMGHLLEGLALRVQSKNQFNEASTAYMIDPKVNIFISQFRTRRQLCDYKCKSFFNLPCFLLFGCNVHLKNFIFAIIIPFIMVVLIAVCCGKKVWSLACWLKYIKLFLGINFVQWLFTKCRQGEMIRSRRQKQKQEENLINRQIIELKEVNIEFNEVLDMKTERYEGKMAQKRFDKNREKQKDEDQNF